MARKQLSDKTGEPTVPHPRRDDFIAELEAKKEEKIKAEKEILKAILARIQTLQGETAEVRAEAGELRGLLREVAKGEKGVDLDKRVDNYLRQVETVAEMIGTAEASVGVQSSEAVAPPAPAEAPTFEEAIPSSVPSVPEEVAPTSHGNLSRGLFGKLLNRVKPRGSAERERADKLKGFWEQFKAAGGPALIAETGYKTVASVLGVKTLGDLVLAIGGKGDIANYFKGIKATNTEKNAIMDILNGVSELLKTEAVVGAESTLDAGVANKHRALEQQITTAEYILPADKKRLLQRLQEITTDFSTANTDQKNILATQVSAALDVFVQNKVSGISLVKDAMNMALTASGALFLRGAGYSYMAFAERATKAEVEYKKQQITGEAKVGHEEFILKNVTVNAAVETARALMGKGITKEREQMGKVVRTMDFIKAAGVVARGFGIYHTASTETAHTEHLEKLFTHIFSGSLGVAAEDIARNYAANADRMLDLAVKIKDLPASMAAEAYHQMVGTASASDMPLAIGSTPAPDLAPVATAPTEIPAIGSAETIFSKFAGENTMSPAESDYLHELVAAHPISLSNPEVLKNILSAGVYARNFTEQVGERNTIILEALLKHNDINGANEFLESQRFSDYHLAESGLSAYGVSAGGSFTPVLEKLRATATDSPAYAQILAQFKNAFGRGFDTVLARNGLLTNGQTDLWKDGEARVYVARSGEVITGGEGSARLMDVTNPGHPHFKSVYQAEGEYKVETPTAPAADNVTTPDAAPAPEPSLVVPPAPEPEPEPTPAAGPVVQPSEPAHPAEPAIEPVAIPREYEMTLESAITRVDSLVHQMVDEAYADYKGGGLADRAGVIHDLAEKIERGLQNEDLLDDEAVIAELEEIASTQAVPLASRFHNIALVLAKVDPEFVGHLTPEDRSFLGAEFVEGAGYATVTLANGDVVVAPSLDSGLHSSAFSVVHPNGSAELISDPSRSYNISDGALFENAVVAGVDGKAQSVAAVVAIDEGKRAAIEKAQAAPPVAEPPAPVTEPTAAAKPVVERAQSSAIKAGSGGGGGVPRRGIRVNVNGPDFVEPAGLDDKFAGGKSVGIKEIVQAQQAANRDAGVPAPASGEKTPAVTAGGSVAKVTPAPNMFRPTVQARELPSIKGVVSAEKTGGAEHAAELAGAAQRADVDHPLFLDKLNASIYFVYDADGKIVDRHIGPGDGNLYEMEVINNSLFGSGEKAEAVQRESGFSIKDFGTMKLGFPKNIFLDDAFYQQFVAKGMTAEAEAMKILIKGRLEALANYAHKSVVDTFSSEIAKRYGYLEK
ncbi:MAG: hypothetical protein Q7S66_01545 [bacterium]|nr:hypothetical protein [bacterium]